VAHAILQGSQLAEAATVLLSGVLEAIAIERPDYLLFDMSAPWGSSAALRYGILAVAGFPDLPY